MLEVFPLNREILLYNFLMNSKDLLKTIITDSQKKVLPEIWQRTLKIPTDSGKVVTLTGVRCSGKTYHLFNLMKQLRTNGVPNERLLYFNFEDERLNLSPSELDLILQAYQELYPALNFSDCYFFLDEVQEAPGWEKFVNRIHDSISPKVFITGSNSRLLSQEIATPLRGRTLTFEVYPLSFSEFAQILSPGLNPHSSRDRAALANLFERFMHQGGFPELIRQEDALKDKILQEYFNVMLFRDLIERYQIPNSTILKYFCKRVVGTSAGEFSVHKIYTELKSQGYKVSKDTLYSYQDYVEAIYLNRFVNKWSTSVVKSKSAQRKCYVIDQGLGAALDYKLSQDKERLLETTAALELLKQGKQIAYQQNGSECDFVVTDKGNVTAATQVTLDLSDNKTREREIKGLVQSCQICTLHEGVLLTLDQTEELEREGVRVRILPAWQYFYSL
jgi:predicted AAA+ superfamily ATPase